MPAVIMTTKKNTWVSLEHILPAREFFFFFFKPEKVLRDCGKEFIAQIYKYIRVLKAQSTRSLKLNIQTRSACSSQVLSAVVFILVEEVLRGETKLSLESFIFWLAMQFSA